MPAGLGDPGHDRQVAVGPLPRADGRARRPGLRPDRLAGLREEKAKLGKLSAEQVSADTLAGEKIVAKLTKAPGNDAAIGGLKVISESGWFAARPSGTEDVYKLYAESFRGPDHLAEIQDEARAIVSAALG